MTENLLGPKKMYYKTLQLVDRQTVNKDYCILSFENDEMATACKPGQFFLIKPSAYQNPLLPRPMSVHQVDNKRISFFVKKVGMGTELLCKMGRQDTASLLGPLGNGFQIFANKRALIVSGGIGYAPFPFLIRKLEDTGNKVTFFHGGKTVNDIFSKDAMNFTEDGSCGFCGTVLDGVATFLESNPIDIVYACGPEPMLKRLLEISMQYQLDVQVSLEAIIACGVGACHGCSIKMKENGKIVYKRVCKDGPVFTQTPSLKMKGTEIIWDE